MCCVGVKVGRSYPTLITWTLCTAVRILQWATVLCSSCVSSSIGGFLWRWGWLLLIKSLLWLWINFVSSYSTAASHVNDPTWPKRPAIVVVDMYVYAQDYFASHQQCSSEALRHLLHGACPLVLCMRDCTHMRPSPFQNGCPIGKH